MAARPQSLDPEALKDAFKRAAEIAAVVPASMQEAAFHRALDQILGGDGEPGAQTTVARRQGRSARTAATDETPDSAKQLIDGINRTAYPGIASATKVLDRALAVLELAKRDFDIDGLTAPQIAKVLTEKFRLRTSRQAVTQALAPEHSMVDTRTRGRTTVYRIMQEGENSLQRAGREDAQSETAQPAPSRRRRRTTNRRAKAKSGEATGHLRPTTRMRRARRGEPRGGVGPRRR